MVFKLITIAGWIAVTTAAYAVIDLTPQLSQRELEGITFRQLLFRDGKTQVAYEPPIGWNYTGTSSKLNLLPPDLRQVEATIETMPVAQANASDEARLASLRESALHEVPEGAEKVEAVEADPAVIQVDGKKAAEVTVAYILHGQHYMRSTYLVNLSDSQLKARVTGPAEDFPKLHPVFQKSLCSFQWLPAAKKAQAQP
jgi:hypothetical protein